MADNADRGKRDESYFVDGPIPEDLLPGLTREFTNEEIITIRHSVYLSSAQPQQECPRCLWVCGPPAVGKSTITATKAQELFDSEENAVLVDGSVLRDCHGGWKAVVANGFQRQPRPLIHREAWPMLKKSKVIDTKKKEIFKEAIRHRQHLCIPEAMTNIEKVKENVKTLDEAGYEQHLICLWAPRSVIRVRGEARQTQEGKTFSMKDYVYSVSSCCKLAHHFVDTYSAQRCVIMTTDRFPNLILSISELEAYALAAEQSEEAEKGRASDSQKLQSFRRFKHAGSRLMAVHKLSRTFTNEIEATESVADSEAVSPRGESASNKDERRPSFSFDACAPTASNNDERRSRVSFKAGASADDLNKHKLEDADAADGIADSSIENPAEPDRVRLERRVSELEEELRRLQKAAEDREKDFEMRLRAAADRETDFETRLRRSQSQTFASTAFAAFAFIFLCASAAHVVASWRGDDAGGCKAHV